MFGVEYLDAQGRVLEKIALGSFACVMDADNDAKDVFTQAQRRKPTVIDYRLLNKAGSEVGRFASIHA